MRETLRSILTLARLTATAAPLLAAGELLAVLSAAVTGPLQAYGVGRVVDAVGGQGTVTTGAVILLAAMTVTFTGQVVADAFRLRLEDETDISLQRELLELATSIPGIEHHERPEVADRFGAVREEYRRLRGTAGSFAGGLTVLVSMGTVLALLARIHPLLLSLPLLGLVRLWASARAARLHRQAIAETMEYNRRHTELLDISGQPKFALELRAFGMGPVMTDRIGALFDQQNTPRLQALRRGRLAEVLARAVFGIAYGGAIVLALWLARNGRADAGDVTMVMLLAPQVDQAAQRLARSVRSLVAMLDVVGHIRWLRAYGAGLADWPGDVAPPARLTTGIELRQVSFRYPGTERPVLRDVSVVLQAGSTVALVGENGAGKTTLVKLLSRLYDPGAGSILVDGVDLREMDHRLWRARIAAGFQDFVRYELTMREVVGLGEPCLLGPDAERESTDGVLNRAVDAGDARSIVDRLAAGLDTQLGNRFGGTELSGGQWQRIALARALVRENPLLIMLDEPTAALDPEAEHALFDRFAAASAAARATGGITLLISHRLSTVRMADVILVFADGQLVESGSHQDLIAAEGRYAELFTLQARAYR